MRIRLEHLPADVVGLDPSSAEALASGQRGGLVVARKPAEVQRPEDLHDPGTRQLLAEDIGRGLAGIEVPGRVETSLQVLSNAGTFCVITGQQPGFLCSPLFNLYKALHACRLADRLARDWGVPVVPVFWNHADDHDVAEVHHGWVLNRNLDLQKVGLAGMSSGRQPLSRLTLEDSTHRLGATRAALRAVWEEHERVDEALELFMPREGETLPRAFSRALTELCGAHGLVMVEPDWIRTTLSRELARVVGSDPLPHLLRGSGEAPAIDPGSAALVYRVDESGRRALRPGGEGFRYDGEEGSRSPAELAAEIVQEPERWSAGALLRPVVQDLAFPTCATIGGWGELAYHAQLGPLREACGASAPVFVPRASCTLVEPEVRTALEKAGAQLREVLEARGTFGLETEESAAPSVVEAVREDLERFGETLLSHRSALGELEPALSVNLKRAVDQARGAVEKVLGKAERVHANRAGKGKRQLRRLNHTLFPREAPQERVLGPLGFTARWGRRWIDLLYEELPAGGAEHLVVHLEEPEE